MDKKERRGWLYVAGLICIGLAILGITQCSDSSEYTLNPEKFNIRYVIPVVVIAFGGLMYWLWRQDHK